MQLQLELDRSGLDKRTRLLVLAVVAIQPADWLTFQAVAGTARELGVRRSEFEEALLQATLFYGFPRVVTAFEQLHEVWPADAPPCGGSVPAEQHRARGRALFAAIYGKNDEAVRRKLAAFHLDFHDFVLEAAYGRILSREGLDVATRELMATGALAVSDQTPQLIAHARGAILHGASRDAVREALRCGRLDDSRIEATMTRILASGSTAR